MFARILKTVVILALCAAPLSAKPLSRILNNTGLSPADFDILMATETSLVDRGQVGRTESWTNPQTGTKGASKLVAQRGSCLYLQHFVTLSGNTDRQEIRTAFCQQPDGQWLRAPA